MPWHFFLQKLGRRNLRWKKLLTMKRRRKDLALVCDACLCLGLPQIITSPKRPEKQGSCTPATSTLQTNRGILAKAFLRAGSLGRGPGGGQVRQAEPWPGWPSSWLSLSPINGVGSDGWRKDGLMPCHLQWEASTGSGRLLARREAGGAKNLRHLCLLFAAFLTSCFASSHTCMPRLLSKWLIQFSLLLPPSYIKQILKGKTKGRPIRHVLCVHLPIQIPKEKKTFLKKKNFLRKGCLKRRDMCCAF